MVRWALVALGLWGDFIPKLLSLVGHVVYGAVLGVGPARDIVLFDYTAATLGVHKVVAHAEVRFVWL